MKFLESEKIEDREEHSLFHVIPVPMESSISYSGGTAGGPRAIIEASDQLELWDHFGIWDQYEPLDQGKPLNQEKGVLSYELMPSNFGIHTTAPVECNNNQSQDNSEIVLERIQSAVARALSFHAIPVVLGGEHTVTLGALRALKKHFTNKSYFTPLTENSSIIDKAPSGIIDKAPSGIIDKAPFGIIQIDAHADLRNSYHGNHLSHACVMRRAVDDLDIPLFQIGVRAISREEVLFRRERQAKSHIFFIDAKDIYFKGGAKGIPDNFLPTGFPDNIYITVDVDGLDPSVIRATGTPVPGGIGWYDTLVLLKKSIIGRKIIGFDVVELAPIKGDHASDFAAAQLTYYMMKMALMKMDLL